MVTELRFTTLLLFGCMVHFWRRLCLGPYGYRGRRTGFVETPRNHCTYATAGIGYAVLLVLIAITIKPLKYIEIGDGFLGAKHAVGWAVGPPYGRSRYGKSALSSSPCGFHCKNFTIKKNKIFYPDKTGAEAAWTSWLRRCGNGSEIFLRTRRLGTRLAMLPHGEVEQYRERTCKTQVAPSLYVTPGGSGRHGKKRQLTEARSGVVKSSSLSRATSVRPNSPARLELILPGNWRAFCRIIFVAPPPRISRRSLTPRNIQVT